MTVREFIAELASNSPAPGGGSVAALSGSLAAALVCMVAQLTVNNAGMEEQRQMQMQQVLEQVSVLRQSLQEHVDEDTAAFTRVMEAYRLPKGTAAEREQRSGAIQQALQGAAIHPLKVAGECLSVLRYSCVVIEYGNSNALSDAGVAVLMAYSGVVGALLNVAINLRGIKDQDFCKSMDAEKASLLIEARELRDEAQNILNSRA